MPAANRGRTITPSTGRNPVVGPAAPAGTGPGAPSFPWYGLPRSIGLHVGFHLVHHPLELGLIGALRQIDGLRFIAATAGDDDSREDGGHDGRARCSSHDE